MTNQTHSVNNILKKLWMALAIIIIIAAVFSSLFRSLTPWATQYKVEVEQHLSALVGKPVTVRSMETGWYWFQPVLKLKDLNINEQPNDALHIDKLYVGINLFKSVWNWKIEPGVLYLEDIHLVLREKNKQWSVEGFSSANAGSTEEKAQQVMAWLAQQERLILRNVAIDFHFNNGNVLPVHDLNLSIVNKGGYYKLKGNAQLQQTNPTAFQLLGELSFDPFHLEKTNGEVYFAANHLVLAQWQALFPPNIQRLKGGKGRVAVWVDLKQGNISLVQAQVKLKRLAWQSPTSKKKQMIQSFNANMAWSTGKNGWELSADRINLKVGGFTWPENKLSIKFDKTQSSFQVFAKSIVLESLTSLTVDWPTELNKLIENKPKGILNDTQIVLKDKKPTAFLTRFEQIGWQGKDQKPSVENLTGVLSWQEQEGRLELDSNKASFKIPGYPKQNLDILNAAFDWKELSNGLRLSVDRFVVSKPDLTLTAEGVIDEVSGDSLGNIRLDVAFSGKNIEQWIALIPAKYLKPKLNLWLKQDIKHIPEGTAKISFNGMAKDFPFDNNNGNFSLVGHARNVELTITSKWEPVTNIEAYLRVKNRNLDIDVVNAQFGKLPMQQMNLRIDDIGKDKETLLVYGVADAPVSDMLNYVMSSPLKTKLETLGMLNIQGPALLNLHVEAPLYPENNTILVKGDLTFKDNKVLVNHPVGTIPLEDFSGDLSFDQDGITHSQLKASAYGYPLNISMQSVKLPRPYTTILMDGECTVASLKKRIASPIFYFLKGMFSFKAIFKLTEDPNDLDNLNVKTSLRGLAINLPAPLGKSFDSDVPLEVNLEFNPKKAIRLQSNYNDRLSADLYFDENKGAFDMQSGQLKLGGAHALDQRKPGLALVGNLDGYNLEEWKKVFNQVAESGSESYLLKKLRVINVKLNKFTFLNQQLDQLMIKAKMLANNAWTFDLQQKNIDASLTYSQPTNTLSGYIKHLEIAKSEPPKNRLGASAIKYHPAQIPNLNLRIDNLSLAGVEIGNIILKTKSTTERWLIDYCRIESPIYQVNMEGEWTEKNGKSQTQLHMKMNLINLAKSLEQWKITPAVDAGKGELEFKGGWSNSIFDFSLPTLNGSLFLKLKNGNISHLSPETEEKLGLGKLLSILSLQTIPRRLQLDFSDLSQQGYSFDIFNGNFSIKKGVMNTQDSYLDGPVAYASMKGDLDLVSRMYDLDLSISPHITASLPLVATIAGGPIAGIAAWVANKIISKSMQKITAYTYKITGPWNQPVVQQLTMVKKIIKKK